MSITYRTYERGEVPWWLRQLWSRVTRKDPHLLTMSSQRLEADIQYAVIAFDRFRPIGFSGLVVARSADEQITWEDRLVVEVGSDYVKPKYRRHGVWHQLLGIRTVYARRKYWATVCVTTVDTVRHGLREIGFRPISGVSEHELLKRLCLNCDAQSRTCAFCPLGDEAAWIIQ